MTPEEIQTEGLSGCRQRELVDKNTIRPFDPPPEVGCIIGTYDAAAEQQLVAGIWAALKRGDPGLQTDWVEPVKIPAGTE